MFVARVNQGENSDKVIVTRSIISFSEISHWYESKANPVRSSKPRESDGEESVAEIKRYRINSWSSQAC